MEDSWILSTPMLLSATTPTLEMKEINIQGQLSYYIDNYLDVVWDNVWRTKRQFKHNQPIRSLLDNNSWWVWAMHLGCNSSICKQRRSTNVKKQDWNGERRNNKLKHDVNEKELFMNSLTGQFNESADKYGKQKAVKGKNSSTKYISLQTRDWFAPPQNTQDEVSDKEQIKYQEKQI